MQNLLPLQTEVESVEYKCSIEEQQEHKIGFMKRLFTGNTNTANMNIFRPPEDQHLLKNLCKTI